MGNPALTRVHDEEVEYAYPRHKGSKTWGRAFGTRTWLPRDLMIKSLACSSLRLVTAWKHLEMLRQSAACESMTEVRSTSGQTQTGLTTRVRVQLLPFPLALLSNCILTWEFPKIRATLFWGPYDKDPTIWGTILLGFGVPYFNTFFP